MAPPSSSDDNTTAVVCGCFGSSSRSTSNKRPSMMHKKASSRSNNKSNHGGGMIIPPNEQESVDRPTLRSPRSLSVYHQAEEGSFLTPLEQFDDDLFFFDAVQSASDLPDHHGDDEDEEELYPIITTTTIRPKPRVSMLEPETMLFSTKTLRRYSNKRETSNGTTSNTLQLIQEDEELEDEEAVEVVMSSSFKKKHDEAAAKKEQSAAAAPAFERRISKRVSQALKKTSVESRTTALAKPTITIAERGFPGQLTPEELKETQAFAEALRTKEYRSLANIVYCFSDFEEEPYALCRFMRPTKFDSSKMIQRLKSTEDIWSTAKDADFYPDLEQAMGCPYSLFLTQYPFLTIGRARNGCPVNYFLAGTMNPEGLLCLTELQKATAFFWHQAMHIFPKNFTNSQKANPDLVRTESVNVIDLKGLSASAISTDALECVKLAGKVGDFFPESMHCTVILNAPTFFSVSWSVIKGLIDPRTAQRIQVFSNKAKGLARMSELIAADQLPSNYGGTAPSTDQAFLKARGLKEVSPCRKQNVHLVQVRRRATSKVEIAVQAKESLNVRVYTRSASSATVTVTKQKGGTTTTPSVQAQGILQEGGALMHSTITKAADKLSGPATYIVEIKENDDVPAQAHRSLSRGYFLIEEELIPVASKKK